MENYCLNLNLKNNKVAANSKVKKLAAITGISFTANPYTSHIATPRQKSENIPKDKSLADRLFHVFITCGRNAAVVNAPANNPKLCIAFIWFLFVINKDNYHYLMSLWDVKFLDILRIISIA